MVRMNNIGNGWFECPACGKRKHYTVPGNAFFMNMGKVPTNIQIDCPCTEKTKENKSESSLK